MRLGQPKQLVLIDLSLYSNPLMYVLRTHSSLLKGSIWPLFWKLRVKPREFSYTLCYFFDSSSELWVSAVVATGDDIANQEDWGTMLTPSSGEPSSNSTKTCFSHDQDKHFWRSFVHRTYVNHLNFRDHAAFYARRYVLLNWRRNRNNEKEEHPIQKVFKEEFKRFVSIIILESHILCSNICSYLLLKCIHFKHF